MAHNGTQVNFTGSGSDEDGSITGYQWRSSLDGVLSSSASFSTTSLSVGNHTIYFKVKDNDTLWSTEASSWVRINGYPQLASYAWDSGSVLRAATAVLSVAVSDHEDGNGSLTIVMQYRSSSGGWSDSYLASAWYNTSASRWQANFTPPSAAELGDTTCG